MSTEYDIASALARDGLKALKGVLESIMSFEAPVRVKFTRELTEVVKAAAVVMKEEREQMVFEKDESLTDDDIADALKAHLSSLSVPELRALMANALAAAEARAGSGEAHA